MESFIGVAIAAVIGVVVGMDAKKRGMNPFGWGIFVFLICIIGLPAYLIVSRNHPVQPEGGQMPDYMPPPTQDFTPPPQDFVPPPQDYIPPQEETRSQDDEQQ